MVINVYQIVANSIVSKSSCKSYLIKATPSSSPSHKDDLMEFNLIHLKLT